MTAMTTPRARVPHPVQAGPRLALTWLGLRALNLGIAVTVVFFAPAIGALVAQDPEGGKHVTAAAGLLVFTVIAASLLGRYLRRAVDMGVPGALHPRTTTDGPADPTDAPNVVADGVECAVVSVTAFVAGHLAVTGDYGVAAGWMAAYAGALLVIGVSRVVRDLLHNSRRWRRSVTRAALKWAVPSMALLAAAGPVAARGTSAPPESRALASRWRR